MDTNKKVVTRADLGELLASIGAPGKKQAEKVEAVKKLNLKNKQGHDVSETLHSYVEF